MGASSQRGLCSSFSFRFVIFFFQPLKTISLNHPPAEEDGRPLLPDDSRFNTQGLQDILRKCWNAKPDQRPTFSKLVKDFKQLRKSCGQEVVDSPGISVTDEVSERTASPSPDMRPTRLPESTQPVDNDLRELDPCSRFSYRY